MRDLLPFVSETLAADRALVLSMVVGRRGSLPMARCAKMVASEDGTTRGTVGGGCLEAEVWAVGRRLLDDGGCSLDTFHLTEIEEGLGGHVCGGTVTILTRVLRPTSRTLALVDALREAIEGDRPVGLVTGLPEAEGASIDVGWALVEPGSGVRTDGIEVDETTLERCLLVMRDRQPARIDDAPAPLFVEPLAPTPTALIFGAGHCGRAIGRVAAGAGFRVRMFDDREPFLSAQTLPWAESRERVDFDDVAGSLEIRPHHYLVIVTRGHEHDMTLLRQLVEQPAAYLGMIGSERKRLMFESALRGEGMAESALARLRSPMGLPIGADTPEEIAVAVVGEMIAVRRGVADRDAS